MNEQNTEQQGLKSLLQQNLQVAQENNALLKRMIKIGRIAFWAKVVIWAIVLLLPILLIPYILPFLKSVPGFGSTSTSTTLFGFPSPTEVQNAIHAYQAQK